jgi:diguanylate cyclase (GGDEF)-like protein
MGILIVDDSEDMRTSLRSVLEAEGFEEVVTARSADDAYRVLGFGDRAGAAGPIDVILMDITMPRTDGVAAVKRIREEVGFGDLPIIMVTGRTEEYALEAAFRAGATDYVTKPIKIVELLARLRAALTLKRELDCRRLREQELLAATQQLQEANQTLQRLSNVDALTGVANRRYFNGQLAHEWARAVRDRTPLSIVMIDIDAFKAYNDHYGHPKGDECLRQVARALASAVKRPGDLLARYGGEEFVVLLPKTSLHGAVALAEEARQRVERLGLAHAHSPVLDRVTISLGVASIVPDRHEALEDLIVHADQALYQAKKQGRNGVQVFAEMPDPSWVPLRTGTR